ncbi:MAG: VIT domain-containing protein [Deltaproteobacteria bacterium]|nr:VIT domain-containing protein [Myxococcales bacterium]MDP3219029.1 VIT domain-containing protein [Deltaproteobacteria bacterium]
MNHTGLYSKNGVAIPLKGVEVEGEVLGAHARVRVRQRYCNEAKTAVEAVYTFPLPADATLTAFAMTCAGRRLEGAVKEREAAFRQYDDAVVAGHGAALLEQERPDVFTATVGNLLPGEETLVEVEYVQRVSADEGSLRWMIPTLVAPRYIPGSPGGDRTAHGESAPTDRVPDADRITPPRAADVPYGLRLDLVFDLGRAVTVASPSHAITTVAEGSRVRVRFAQAEVALDRDVVLTAHGAGAAATQAAGIVAHRAIGGDGYLALSVVPDLAGYGGAAAAGVTVVFLVDVSGSMAGASIIEARAALRLCLRHLRAGDRFNVIAFSTQHASFEREAVPFTQASMASADRWIDALSANGGTEMLEPLVLATAMAGEGGVVMMLTDGEVGNGDEIVQAVLKRRGESRARVYSFGIGTNVSDALLRDLARETGAAVEFIHPGERIDEKVVAQFSRAVAPRVTDVAVRFVGVDVGEVAPGRTPDLVDGEPWVLLARYTRGGGGTAEITGRWRGSDFALRVPVDLPEEVSRPVVAKLWAAERIRDLEDARVEGRRAESMKARITALAVEHQIASRYTSFVVVEQRTGDRRVSGMPDTVVVPVGLPAGWAMFESARGEGSGGMNVNKTSRSRVGAAMKRSAPPMAAVQPGPMALVPRAFDALMSPAPAAMARPAMKAAPAPAPMAPLPPKGAAPQGEAAKKRKMVAREESDDAYSALSDSEDLAMFEAGEVAAPAEAAPVDDLGAVFGRQLASGLWDDAALGADNDLRRLRATARVLRTLVERGVDTTHALYGVPLRKALEAVVVAAASLAAQDAATCERALGAAWLLAMGPRTRAAVEAAIGHGGYATLGPMAGDAARVRAWVLGPTG